jgi:hypothetical protein
MGSIQHDDIHNQKHYSNESGNLVVARLNGDDVKTFEVAGLASDEESSPAGMRDEIVLLSWLIVLLRTREGGHIRYEWAYRRTGEEPVPRSLAMNEVVAGLQSSVRETAVAVTRHIATDAPSQSTPASLLLSTSSLSQTSDEAKDEVSQRVDVEYQKLADCGKQRAYFIWKSASRTACSRLFRHGTLKICCHLQ